MFEDEIKQRSPKEVLNDNELFEEWVYSELSLSDVIRRCPSLLTEIFEEFSNDFFDEIERSAANLDIEIDEIGNVLRDQNDIDQCYNDGWEDHANGEENCSQEYDEGEGRQSYIDGWNDFRA